MPVYLPLSLPDHRGLALGLTVLITGLVVFIWGRMLFTTRRDARGRRDRAHRRGPYKGFYSLVSLIGLALIIYGFALYRSERLDRGLVSADLDAPPSRSLLVLAARSFCVVAAYIPGDIKTHAETSDAGRREAVGVRRISSPNGDLGSIVLFGSFLAWAVYDRITLKHRDRSRRRRRFRLGGRE